MKKNNSKMTKRDEETRNEKSKVNDQTNTRNKRTSNSKRNSNVNRRKRADVNQGSYDSADNDASWYMRYPELANDASKIPFTTPLGKYPLIGSNAEDSSVKFSDTAFSVPGVLSVDWMPTIGQSDKQNSPINIVSREVYSFIRHANSGHSNYDAPDMMMYILAMDSLYSFYASMVRVYGIMMLYSGMNRYMPRTLVESLGYDFDDISKNIAQFRWLINQVAYKLTAMYVPSGMSYFERHIWLNSGVYLDSSSYKAQTYVFRQKAFYKYAANSGTNYAAKLLYTEVPDKLTLAKCEAFINSLLNPILADEDMNIISGDMLRAFGADNLFTVSPISEDYVVVPTYSQEVLSQIQNLTIMGRPDTSKDTFPGSKADIVQRINTGDFTTGIYQNLTFIGERVSKSDGQLDRLHAWNYVCWDRFITMLSDNPSSDEIMVASRLTNICDVFGIEDQVDGSTTYEVVTFGASSLSTEVVNSMTYYTMSSTGVVYKSTVDQHYLFGADLKIAPTNAGWKLRDLSQISAFDWHPLIYLFNATDTANVIELKGMVIETNNFTTLDEGDLSRLHETALISEFYIPDVRKLSAKPTTK